MLKKPVFFFFLFVVGLSTAQNIKTIQLRTQQQNNFSAIVPLGTILELSFDDLDADSKDYQYKIEHKTHDWQPSRLLSSQYIDGFDQNTIINVTNSFNTFQNYTHYSVQIPNINTIITKSGNYLLSVLDDYDEVVFTRRFVLFENATTIGVSVSRSRETKSLNTQQTVELIVNHPNVRINTPAQEINVVLLKNENWNEKKTNLQPTFFSTNQLKYTHTNKTNFWGGNEYLNFDTKFVSNRSLNVVKIALKDIFHHYLFPFTYSPIRNYQYNPDINGQFIVRSIEAQDTRTEADYAMMHFTVYANEPFKNKDVHIYGAFNNFEINDENKMKYHAEEKAYKGTFLIKQGFYNYTYATVGFDGIVNTSEVNGTFFETENVYKAIIYFKPFGSLYDRVIGIGTGFYDQNR